MGVAPSLAFLLMGMKELPERPDLQNGGVFFSPPSKGSVAVFWGWGEKSAYVKLFPDRLIHLFQ